MIGIILVEIFDAKLIDIRGQGKWSSCVAPHAGFQKGHSHILSNDLWADHKPRWLVTWGHTCVLCVHVSCSESNNGDSGMALQS